MPAYVRSLATIPTELVHQVLDDLTYIKVLQIISYNVPYLDDCILSHESCRHAFGPSSTEMSDIRAEFLLYRDICLAQSIPLSPRTSHLSLSVSVQLDLWAYLHREVTGLTCRARAHLNFVSAYFPIPFPVVTELFATATSVPDLRKCWALFGEAEQQFNAVRSGQLERAADLKETYPGKLKQLKDPSQNGPRAKFAHVVESLRRDAKRVLNDRMLKKKKGSHANCIFKMHNLPLVPYDGHLALFLDTIAKHPPAQEKGEIMATSPLSEPNDHGKPYRYPSEMAADITTVLNGLVYIYTTPVHSVNSSELPFRFHPPMNSPDVDLTSEPKFLLAPKKYDSLFKYALGPLDEREYEWLSAFLRVVTWMENSMGKELFKSRKLA